MSKEYGIAFSAAVAEELRAAKARKRVTDKQISEAAGVHRVTVGRFLNGTRDIPMSVFGKMCKYLEVTPDTLMRRVESTLAKEIPQES